MLISRNTKLPRALAAYGIAIVLGSIPVASTAAVEQRGLGSGDPGLKVATRGTEAVVIYRDEPATVGVGLRGGMMTRSIEILIDHQYHFQKDRMDVPSQLFPLDADSAFASSVGKWSAEPRHWEYLPRVSVGYRISDGQLTTIPDVQRVASEKYRLEAGEVFLGFIDNRVFFWRNFNPAHVYWRELGNAAVYSADLPAGVIDVYGATRGIQKDVGFVVFRKAGGRLPYSPYTHDFIEISFTKGVSALAP